MNGIVITAISMATLHSSVYLILMRKEPMDVSTTTKHMDTKKKTIKLELKIIKSLLRQQVQLEETSSIHSST